MAESGRYIHPEALCESSMVGENTRVWAFAHILDGAVIGRDCNIGDGVFIENGARIGDRVTIKNGVMIWQGVSVGDDVFVGPGVVFTNDRYPRSPRMPEMRTRYERVDRWLAPTNVQRGASIGAGAVIVCGITIGRCASIGAGAVVTKNVPDHRLMVGHPARPVGWVCHCGMKLDKRLHCVQCGKQYDLENGHLVESGVLFMVD